MSISIQKAFGICVRKFRMDIGLSQEKFAFKIDMDRTYYASVESGKRNISIVNIDKIASGLGVSLADLFSAVESYMKNDDGQAI